ncbi:hypothetical protein N7532_010387 [Penicillium argentinense]|uniref:Ubiquitin-like domain-containing protein n=1 Tax=Penicillium argentinense TaxID=1131581 RepID=A0A9W9EPS7_9EURO|nr:uncharacterized protein N7532_010387 [Penicillium argentinense]KAJ5085616.1 hypothetical protein N7532_010387 [Penicillium argentinense]
MDSYGPSRVRRQASPESPGSPDSEEFANPYPRATRDRWPPAPPPPPPGGYAQSASSGQTFNGFPPGGHGAYAHPSGALQSDQLIRHPHANPAPQPYGYPYGAQFQGPHGGAMHPFYAQDQALPRHPSRQPPHAPYMAPPSPFAGSPFHHEMVAYAPNAYYNYRDPYAMMPGMHPQSYFPQYPHVPTPTQQPEAPPAPTPAPAPQSPASAPAPTPAPPPADAAKDEAIARLEKLILDERTEREAKEAARVAAIEREAAEKAAREQQLAHDRKIAQEAAALARADAEKRAAEEAAKAKEEAEKAAAAAASEAAAAATAAAAAAAAEAASAAAPAEPAPPEKKKPIKFKDAVGRKFSFPFELCATWQGMEDLIKQAFLHIEVIGPHVADGHYDLVGPNGDIILPQVWETVIEPDWSITMHMWPIPEKPKEADPPPADPPPADPLKEAAPAPAEPKKDKPPVKKPRVNPGQPSGFASWIVGGRKPPRPKAAPKTEKKPEPAS